MVYALLLSESFRRPLRLLPKPGLLHISKRPIFSPSFQQRLTSDQAVENQSPCPSQNNRSGKRKEFEKKVTPLISRDLSSNMLTGTIPDTFRSLIKYDFMFLSNNSLTGQVPQFILDTKRSMDLSYNNFTQPPTLGCTQLDVNLISSYPSVTDNSAQWCLREDLPCPRDAQHSSLFINCGGSGIKIKKDKYEEDLNGRGASSFFPVAERSGYSSSGIWGDDIYVQGNLFQRDFNIAERAGGVGKPFTRQLDEVQVNGSTLEIHLQWSGKGSIVIPKRGVYGPLISAITITPNFKVDTGKPFSNGAVAGIVIAACAMLIVLLLRLAEELRGLDLQTGSFTLKQIKRATNNFDPENKIGEGGFGPVYKGVLADGMTIAVKQLSSKSKQGNREFVTETGMMIYALQHPNLVKHNSYCFSPADG
ncbi:unnamed protein product [Microthlaspi erraticum]|uniref:non-specific serine/threonine protein kinase n=1 Tax=Microthlaspi erraticum TaxID=1685480 RepID=A0A6D2KXM9_9BRAS|nr:unnamed protein product [Microthlaspi erraticum]